MSSFNYFIYIAFSFVEKQCNQVQHQSPDSRSPGPLHWIRLQQHRAVSIHTGITSKL